MPIFSGDEYKPISCFKGLFKTIVLVLLLAWGHFVLFGTYDSDREEVARLESEWMEAVDQACLDFWHRAEGWTYNSKPNLWFLTQIPRMPHE